MRRLFINADDFGLSPGVCEGVERALAGPLVGGTTAMVCMPGSAELVALRGPALAGRMGLHLMLTAGRPCLAPESLPSLVGPGGGFPRRPEEVGRVRAEEVLAEWRAQAARLRGLGVEPSHLDSHHHVHLLPAVWPAYLELARELGLPARAGDPGKVAELRAAGVACSDVLVVDWFGPGLTAEGLGRLLAEAARRCPPEGAVELMCHPGLCDQALRAISTYAGPRENELAVLCDPATAEMVAGLGLRPCGPAELARGG